MKTTYLIYNDTVYFMSPSMAPQERHMPTIEKSRKMLEKMGLKVYQPTVDEYFYMGGKVGDRLKQFDEFLSGDYKIAMPVVGGKSCNQLLEFLPYDRIKETRKIFLGLSDFTAILLAIYSQTGLTTFHFSDPAGGMGNNPEWSSRQLESFFDPNAEYYVKFSNNSFCVNSGVAEGVLLGGNLSSVCRMVGTKYCPDFANTILFLEACNTSVGEVDAFFGQLKQSGILDKVKGLILGSFFQADKEMLEMKYSFSQLLENWNFSKSVPVLKTNMFGHFTDNVLLPEGLNVRFDSLKMELNGLEPLFEK